MANPVLFCTNCGQMNEANAAFCSRCGAQQPVAGQPTAAPTGVTAPPSGVSAQQAYAPAATAFHGYAGFWLRFVAFIIDMVVIGVVTWPLAAFFNFGFHHVPLGRPHVMFPFFFGGMFLGPIRFFLGWFYWAGMESSSYQATLGKMALGLKVTDMSGSRISFARASGRYFAKILSWMTLTVGFMMAGFTQRKQALEDILAGTLVVKR